MNMVFKALTYYTDWIHLCACRLGGAATYLDIPPNFGMVASQEKRFQAIERRMRLNLYENKSGADDDTFLALLETNGLMDSLLE